MNGELSDLVNLARAKDAGLSLALGILNHRKKQDQETGLEAPPVRQKRPPYVRAAPGLSESLRRAAP